MKISIIDRTSWEFGFPSSAGPGDLARFRTKIYQAAAAPMTIAAMEQPTAIPTTAPLLRPDELASLLLLLAVSELPFAVGTGELVGVILVLNAVVVDIVELDEEEAARTLAMCFPSPRLQQVKFCGPQQ